MPVSNRRASDRKVPSVPTTFNDVQTGDLCSGCGGCAAMLPGAIKMQMRDPGLLRPELTRALTQAEGDQVKTICPGAGQDLPQKATDLFGPLHSLHKGHASDDNIRHPSASGGALSAVLVHLLESSQVDGVVHVGADPDHPLRNRSYVSGTRAQVIARASSRYAPSSPLDQVRALLGDGRTYAFVGKPCDVSALAAWRDLDPEVAKSFPVLLSFLCAGVPSLKGAAQVAQAVGVPPNRLTKFAYRGPGWPGDAIAVGDDGQTGRMSYADSWGGILSKHVQHRCKLCVDGVGMFADLAFGDVWDAGADGYPSFTDRPGQSAILVRSQAGARIISEAQVAGLLHTEPLARDTLAAMQPGQMRRRQAVLARLAGIWVTGRARPEFRGFGLWGAAIKAPPLALVRNFVGMARRAMALPRKGRRVC